MNLISIDKKEITSFRKQLLNWFDKFGRHDLPWQQNITPYRVWVSEIMLQQTQVKTVIPYYHNFMQLFPDVFELASAHLDTVLSAWAGLGYYRRAKFLHQCAQLVVEKYNGDFPTTLDELVDLPGIGKSTAGAIMSLSMDKKGVILDGNVKRVLSRYFAIKVPLDESKSMKHLWQVADDLTPNKRFNHFNQAIMDMGATCCTRTKPLCDVCPFQKNCLAALEGNPEQYPIRIKKNKIKPKRETVMLVLLSESNKILLEKRASDGIWPNLYSFPETDSESQNHLRQLCQQTWQITLHSHIKLDKFTHQFTHFNLEITPIICFISTNNENVLHANNNTNWYDISKAKQMGIPTPIKKIINMIKKQGLYEPVSIL